MSPVNRFRSSRSIPALAGAVLLLAAAAAQAAPSPLSMIQPQQPATAHVAVASPSKAPPAEPPQELTAQNPATDVALEAVGTGDTLHITVFRNPDLTTDVKVSDQGTILFPLVGDVKVTGLTPQQVGHRIATLLRDGKFVVNPEVAVSLAQVSSRQVSVLGNVNKPGRYPIDNVNNKLTDFLAAAGGIAGTGSDAVTIMSTRDGQSTKNTVDITGMFRDGDLTKNVVLSPGDTIYVHRAPMVYVYGEVQKAGAYRLEPHMTVMQAIAMGGGLTVRGTERGVRIHRRDANGNVKKIDASLTDLVQSDDVVFVRESLF